MPRITTFQKLIGSSVGMNILLCILIFMRSGNGEITKSEDLSSSSAGASIKEERRWGSLNSSSKASKDATDLELENVQEVSLPLNLIPALLNRSGKVDKSFAEAAVLSPEQVVRIESIKNRAA